MGGGGGGWGICLFKTVNTGHAGILCFICFTFSIYPQSTKSPHRKHCTYMYGRKKMYDKVFMKFCLSYLSWKGSSAYWWYFLCITLSKEPLEINKGKVNLLWASSTNIRSGYFTLSFPLVQCKWTGPAERTHHTFDALVHHKAQYLLHLLQSMSKVSDATWL